MQRKDIEQRIKPVLIKLHEAHQHQEAGQQMSYIEGDAAHRQKLRETNSSKVAKQAKHQRRAEKCRHAEHTHLGDAVSNTASRTPPTASLAT